MKYNSLYNFISPITGRILSDTDYVLVGDVLGIATPSPIIIDLRLDLIDLRYDLDTTLASSFIIRTPTSILPNAQALDVLANGYMINTGGVISTVSGVPLPDLAYKNIWIGDSANRPVANATITLDNLPALGMPLVPVPDPTHGDLVGNIWEGTITGRPVESGRFAAAFADLLLINARFISANFIMGSGNIVLKTAMPASQFLDGLAAGLLKQDIPGKILRAIPGTDYVDISSVDFDEGFISLLPVNADKLIRKSVIRVVDNQDVDRIRTLRAESINANQNIQAVHNVIGNESLGSRELRFYDYATPYVNYVTFKGPAAVIGTPAVTWTVPSAAGTNGQVMTTDNNNVLSFKNILPDGLNNTLLAQGQVGGKSTFVNASLAQDRFWLGDINKVPTETQYLPIGNLTNLTSGRVWQGDNTGRPIETALDFAPSNAEYVLNIFNNSLPNAQNLSLLISGLVKVTIGTGKLSTALVGVDYPSVVSVTTAQAAAEAAQATATGAATAAAAAPAAGAALAAIYFNEQMLPYSLIPLVPAGVSITTAIGVVATAAASASNSASSAQTTANTAISRIDNLTVTLQGDIIGTGNLSNPIPTTFIPNPVFSGHESLTLPTGVTNQRPSISKVGMLRYNIEI